MSRLDALVVGIRATLSAIEGERAVFDDTSAALQPIAEELLLREIATRLRNLADAAVAPQGEDGA